MTKDIPAELLETRFCIQANLHRTARVIDRIYADEMKPSGVGRSQFTILNVLHRSPDIGVSELAGFLAMERSTLSRNLKPLETSGFVKRSADAQDARQINLQLTATGRKKLQEATRYWAKAQARVVTEFGAERWLELKSQLQALRQAVR